MTYVISDLHGYPLEKLKALLKKAAFGPDDFLYILGDVIDRNGDGGIGILVWLLTQSNVQLILGNHEAMLLACDFLFEEITFESLDRLSDENVELLRDFIMNGGNCTLQALQDLDKETQQAILEYLRECPLYEAITVGDKDYFLVHSGFENFREDRKISDYSADELLWARPKIDTVYYEDVHTILGHTPTKFYGIGFDGHILKTRTWTNIDCGAGHGTEPVLLRLEDFKEFSLA